MDELMTVIYKYFHELIADPSVKDKVLDGVVQYTKDLSMVLFNYCNKQLNDIQCNNESVTFNVPTLINELSTFKIKSHIKSSSPFHLVSYSKTLAQRLESGYTGGIYTQKTVEESFHYFKIFDVIMAVLSDKEKFLKARQGQYCPNTSFIQSDLCGSRIQQQCQIKSDKELLLRLTLYNDDIETVNPLGASTSIHKLSMYYFVINNLHQIGQTDDIHWYACAYSEDVKKYGNGKVLEPFVDELLILEEGVLVKIHGESILLKVQLVSVTGDTLALHQLFEMKGPSSIMFCRECLITRDQFRTDVLATGVPRTKDWYNEMLSSSKDVQNSAGILGNCLLNKLNFHVTDNHVFDLLHDFLEGVTALLIKWILKYYVQQKAITIKEINQRIRNFVWGFLSKKDKPMDNFVYENLIDPKKNGIKQKGVQTWLLIRGLPFLLHDLDEKIPDTEKLNDIKNLLSYHNKILRICFSFKVTVDQVSLLNGYIIFHNNLFFKVFPDASRLNKFHHLMHLARSIMLNGPLRLYWTGRYESAHLFVKQKIHASPQFVNLPKMMCDVYAFNFAYRQQYHEKPKKIHIHASPTSYNADNFPFDTNLYGNLTASGRVTINKIEYVCGMAICMERSSDADILPLFGEILNIGILESEILFKVKRFATVDYNDFFSAFEIIDESPLYFDIWYKDFIFVSPFDIWRPFNTNQMFICPVIENFE